VTGLAGLAAAVLFGAGNALWAFEQPDPGAAPAEIAEFYADTSTGIIVGASLSLVSIALFVLFASGLRALLREYDRDELFANAAFGGAMLMLAAGLGAETINLVGALRAEDGDLSRELARALFEISYVLGFNAAGVGIGVILLAAAAVALRTGTPLPPALAWVTALLGVAFLTPLSEFLLGPSVLLLAVVSLRLLRPQAERHG
jgi:hypothetical protein